MVKSVRLVLITLVKNWSRCSLSKFFIRVFSNAFLKSTELLYKKPIPCPKKLQISYLLKTFSPNFGRNLEKISSGRVRINYFFTRPVSGNTTFFYFRLRDKILILLGPLERLSLSFGRFSLKSGRFFPNFCWFSPNFGQKFLEIVTLWEENFWFSWFWDTFRD